MLRNAGAEFNALCLATSDSLGDPEAIYRYLRDDVGAIWHQYSQRLGDVSTAEWDQFLCGILDAWTADGDAGRVFVRNIEDALIYAKTGIATQCIFGERCDGHVVVERNGDVYPCDFHVSKDSRLGNIMEAGWNELRTSPNVSIARRQSARATFQRSTRCGSTSDWNPCRAKELHGRQGRLRRKHIRPTRISSV